MSDLLLLDWDDTVIDPRLQINDQRLPILLGRKMQEGWLIGLNSDTPLERLRTWSRELHLNGPIIAERGAVVWWPNAEPVAVSRTEPDFEHLRGLVLLLLQRTNRLSVFMGDNVGFLSSVRALDVSDTHLVAMDAYRRCSLGLFVRRIAGDGLAIDIAATEDIAAKVGSLVADQAVFSSIYCNTVQGFIRVNAQDADKGSGVRHLMNFAPGYTRIVMIGDSMSDYLNIPGVQQLAVGNASQEYKAVVDLVASEQYAKGCYELISGL